ncbi:hypothetical protein ACR80S_10205 [Halomonas sp. MA07-2]|uniref:hypothetical protein n=1 Tax=unclassified Halomonas TaxID=2609666 RepID=UPI003EEB316E
MGRFVVTLAVLAGLVYGGLYVYYGHAARQAIKEQLEARGLTAVEVESLDYGLLAPVSQEADIAVRIRYRGVDATLDVRVMGHPVFSDEVRLELDGLQALRLSIGLGG